MNGVPSSIFVLGSVPAPKNWTTVPTTHIQATVGVVACEVLNNVPRNTSMGSRQSGRLIMAFAPALRMLSSIAVLDCCTPADQQLRQAQLVHVLRQ